MAKLDELLLLSGSDIPYPSAQLQIHQPTLKDISVVGEKNFFTGAGLLQLDKDSLNLEDNSVLEKISNFDILMMMIQNPQPETQMMKINMLMVLAVLFPTYTIEIQVDKIVLKDIKDETGEKLKEINKDNFDDLKSLLEQILCLNMGKGETKYNPQSPDAKRIAEKLKKGRVKAAQEKNNGKGQPTSLLSRYVSILAVGEQKDMNQLIKYTLPQIFEEYQRYSAKLQFDINMSARLAGATKLDEPKNWMDDLNDS